MKKIVLALLPIVMIFTACEGVNQNIDDLPRTLRISVRTMDNTDNTWSQTEDDALVVSSGNGSLNGTIGDVSVTPAQDSYVRSDSVTATASNPGAGMEFAFWMLPARTDEDRDPLSTEGNIRYSATGTDTISLRTDYAQSEIIGAFANDGNAGTLFTALNIAATPFSTSLSGESSVDVFISLEKLSAGDITIRNAMYRLFDEGGEAITDWENYVQDDEQTVTGGGGTLDLTVTVTGITDRSQIDSWSAVIIYEDPTSDEVYVVK